jgi:hypothetical protein
MVCRLVCCALVLQLYCVEGAGAQTPTTEPLGSLQTSGEVYLNSLRATGSATVFPGDAVRTGADGAATFTSPGVGLLTLAPQSEIDFRGAPVLGTLKQGTVGIRSLQAGQNLEIQFGSSVLYLPPPGAESVATITVAADGSARVECRMGAVGLRSVSGGQLLVLNSGFAVGVGADGKVQKVEPVGAVSTAQISGSGPRSYLLEYVLIGAAGAGAITAIVLLTRKSNPTLSPYAP